ncbi:MAG: hypothetical protein R3E12_17920 [Candidatus Eisenbacteria bacterium]
MKLRTRLILLTMLVILLPALPAMWVTRNLVGQSLNLGLSTEITNALEAGIRQTRASYQRSVRASKPISHPGSPRGRSERRAWAHRRAGRSGCP